MLQFCSGEVMPLYATISDHFLITSADIATDWPHIISALTASSQAIVPGIEWSYSRESCNPSGSLAEALGRVLRPKPAASGGVSSAARSPRSNPDSSAGPAPALWLALRESLRDRETEREKDPERRSLQESWKRCTSKWQSLDVLADERQSLYSKAFYQCCSESRSYGWLRLDVPGFGLLACRHAHRGIAALREFSRVAEHVFMHEVPVSASAIAEIALVHSAPDDIVAIGTLESLSRFQEDIADVIKKQFALSPRAACVPMEFGTTPANAATRAQGILAEIRSGEAPGA